MKYFWTPNPIGLNADIERHRKAQQELEQKIAELEKEDTIDPNREFYLRVYRNALCILLQSKAEVVAKLGKTKE